MERSKQDHWQKVEELKQQHMLQLEQIQHDQKLLINSQMTKARLGESVTHAATRTDTA